MTWLVRCDKDPNLSETISSTFPPSSSARFCARLKAFNLQLAPPSPTPLFWTLEGPPDLSFALSGFNSRACIIQTTAKPKHYMFYNVARITNAIESHSSKVSMMIWMYLLWHYLQPVIQSDPWGLGLQVGWVQDAWVSFFSVQDSHKRRGVLNMKSFFSNFISAAKTLETLLRKI